MFDVTRIVSDIMGSVDQLVDTINEQEKQIIELETEVLRLLDLVEKQDEN